MIRFLTSPIWLVAILLIIAIVIVQMFRLSHTISNLPIDRQAEIEKIGVTESNKDENRN